MDAAKSNRVERLAVDSKQTTYYLPSATSKFRKGVPLDSDVELSIEASSRSGQNQALKSLFRKNTRSNVYDATRVK
ncbi:hypothetical protein T4A_5358 [Trichinella pseudospiralis]|uniref:Uncharacterized protein n=1 Tax=Trichinella pseudospiralis TaxID=6337 RepID=A0A0V1K2M6_TRIPS|nr:hypothetical protein T4A_5358 [Trichinella pseudospiralis]KRZ41451.1 hypothetical protein T4C_1173 [Trichinella pseudospiralis]